MKKQKRKKQEDHQNTSKTWKDKLGRKPGAIDIALVAVLVFMAWTTSQERLKAREECRTGIQEAIQGGDCNKCIAEYYHQTWMDQMEWNKQATQTDNNHNT